jgi:hypothetical protein
LILFFLLNWRGRAKRNPGGEIITIKSLVVLSLLRGFERRQIGTLRAHAFRSQRKYRPGKVEFIVAAMFGWVSGPALKTVDEYMATLKRYPNPPPANITQFRSGG